MNIADSSRHLDYEALADLAEGLLDDARAASAGRHLAECAECQARQAELADVSRILAEAPMPTMPVQLAARIDAALVAEHRASGLPDELHTAINAPRRMRRLQALSAAAAAVVVLGGGATVAKIMMSSSATSDDGAAAVTAPTDRSPGQAMRPDLGNAPAAPRAAGEPNVYVATGTDYRDATLNAQINAALNKRTQNQAVSAIGVKECVQSIAAGRTPVLVDMSAHYRGRQVIVVAFQQTGSRDLDIVISGPTCATGHPDVISQAHAVAN